MKLKSAFQEGRQQKAKFKSVFQGHGKMKKPAKNEKWKWNLNSIFPCHGKMVGTKVHTFSLT